MTARTRRFLTLALAAAFAGGVALAGVGVSAQAPPPPPPPPGSSPAPQAGTPQPLPTVAAPPTPTATVTPLPVVTVLPSHGRHRSAPAKSGASPAPTATPTSPAFATLDGTWELQVQYADHTTYSYLVLRQKESALSGFWRNGKTETPLEGTYDGRLIRMTVKQTGGDISFAGYVENASDMVGEVDFGKAGEVAFTAEHRGDRSPHGLLQKY